MSSVPIVPPEPTTVVIVDDTPDLRDLLRLALERNGDFRVVGEAADGREALEVVEAHTPDLVLLDIAMPVMDGLEALPLVRAACPGATVVMLSGFGASTMTSKALAAGAHGYLQKGQPLSSLIRRLHALLDRNGAGPTTKTVEASRSTEVVKSTEVAKSTGAEENTAGAASDGHDVLGGTVTRIPTPTAGKIPPAATDPSSLTPPHRSRDHLAEAPIGFLHVHQGSIVSTNREAVRLLGDLARTGVALDSVLPALAEHLQQVPHQDSTVVLELGDPPRRVVATVRQLGPDTVVYLHTQAGDEIELLRRAIGTAAHEIRTPVSVLMGVAETLLLHQDDLSDDERERMLDAIGRQTRLLDSITADLLAAGQAQYGTLTMQLEEIDLGELVRTLLAESPEVTVEDHSDRLALGDPLRFQQMLTNLLSNARKYGEPPIRVRLESTEDGVAVHVEDRGPGVPAEFRPHLFQEYQRARGTDARGTGLGLFVVRALAEAQGGQVTYAPARTEGTSRGSIFTMTLPYPPD